MVAVTVAEIGTALETAIERTLAAAAGRGAAVGWLREVDDVQPQKDGSSGLPRVAFPTNFGADDGAHLAAPEMDGDD